MGDEAYSRLSTTHGHITDCKLDSVVYAGVCVVIFMWTCLVWTERSGAIRGSNPGNAWAVSYMYMYMP